MKRKTVSIILQVTFLLLPVSGILIHSGGHIGLIANRIHGYCGLIFTISAIYQF